MQFHSRNPLRQRLLFPLRRLDSPACGLYFQTSFGSHRRSIDRRLYVDSRTRWFCLRGEGVQPLRVIDLTASSPRYARRLATGRWILVLAACAGMAPWAWAQAGRGPNWEVIRKSPFETLDKRSVQQWAASQIQELLTGRDAVAISQTGAEVYAAITQNYLASDATTEFKNGLAEIIGAVFSAQYKPTGIAQGGSNPLGASTVLMALRDISHRAALPGLRAALKDPTPGPRLVAAEGLTGLRDSLNDTEWSAVLPDLQSAGSAENNNLALSKIYRALFTDNAARADAAVSAVLAILNARFTAFSEQKYLPVSADGEAAAWLASRVERTNNNQIRTAICQHIARLVVQIVDAYLSVKQDRTQKEQLERAMLTAEQALIVAVRVMSPNAAIPDPPLRTVMLGPAQDRVDKLEAVLAQWVGSTASAGLLNQAPFNLPRGLNAQRKPHLAPTTEPATTEPEDTQPGE